MATFTEYITASTATTNMIISGPATPMYKYPPEPYFCDRCEEDHPGHRLEYTEFEKRTCAVCHETMCAPNFNDDHNACDDCVSNGECECAICRGVICACCGDELDTNDYNWCQECQENGPWHPDSNTDGHICPSCYGDEDLCNQHYDIAVNDPDSGHYREPAFEIADLPWGSDYAEVAADATMWWTKHNGMDASTPWTVATRLWGMQLPSPQHPAVGFADFYLSEIVMHRLFNPGDMDPIALHFADLAEAYHEELVTFWDSQFVAYFDMIAGGEARHSPRLHEHLGEIIPGGDHRSASWVVWKFIRDNAGVAALEFVADAHRACDAGNVSGPRWATITETVLARVTNKINPKIYVDRCWSLIHNGGNALNKLSWGNKSGAPSPSGAIQYFLGPAQASDPPNIAHLLTCASPRMHRLWREYIKCVNQYQRVHRQPLRQTEIRSPRESEIESIYCNGSDTGSSFDTPRRKFREHMGFDIPGKGAS